MAQVRIGNSGSVEVNGGCQGDESPWHANRQDPNHQQLRDMPAIARYVTSRFSVLNRHSAKPESGLASRRVKGRRAPLTIPACLRLNGCFRKSSAAGAGKKNSLRSNSFFPDRPICTIFPGRSESAQIVVPASDPHYFLNAFRAKQCKSQAFSLCKRTACALFWAQPNAKSVRITTSWHP